MRARQRESDPTGVGALAQEPVIGYPCPLGARQVEQGGKQSGADAATWRDYFELCLIGGGAAGQLDNRSAGPL